MIDYPEGTIAVWDMQRDVPITRPAKEPDENQEYRIIKDGHWVPLRKSTPIEILEAARADAAEARHWLDSLDERLDQLEEML